MTAPHPTAPTATGPVRVFRQNQAAKLLSAVVLTALALVCSWFIVPTFVPDTYSDRTDQVVAVGVGVALGLCAFIAIMWRGNFSVRVGPHTVELLRLGRVVDQWGRSGTLFSTQITRQYVNGIRSGTVRQLSITDHRGTKEVTLGNLGRQQFNELNQLLCAPAEAHRAHADAQTAWTQPSAPIRRSFRTRVPWWRPVAPVLALVGLVMVVGSIVYWATQQADGDLLTVVAALSLIVGPPLLGISLAAWLRQSRRPRLLVVESAGLTVDDHAFGFGHVRQIWLSPANYDQRELRVVDATGRTHRWNLGTTRRNSASEVMPDWPEFVELLQRAGRAARPGVVALDLG